MPSYYAAIREANKAEYGNVGRWGRDVLVNRYDSSAHFVFELLQNAEDALKRRNGWNGSREVRFELTPTSLRITHCGNPFTLKDVKGVCGVGETTKDLTDIGRFGIGFKSVYAITDRPEVHSGEEDFAIENFVFPTAAPPTNRASDQTEFVLPLRNGDADLFPLVADSLSKLGARTLLFLGQIEEIAWSVNGGACGLYLKEKAEDVGVGSRRVTLVGERKEEHGVEETWLVFSRESRTEAGILAGFIEIAFLLQADNETKKWAIQHVDASPLCAFFPTVVTTHLGFLVQGPYRTTPVATTCRPGIPGMSSSSRKLPLCFWMPWVPSGRGIFSMSRRCSACQLSGPSTPKAVVRTALRCGAERLGIRAAAASRRWRVDFGQERPTRTNTRAARAL